MIPVSDQFTIRADAECWTLLEKHVAGEKSSTPGEVSWKPVGYYPRIDQMLDTMIRRGVAAEGPQSLCDLAAYVQKTRADLLRAAGDLRSHEFAEGGAE